MHRPTEIADALGTEPRGDRARAETGLDNVFQGEMPALPRGSGG